MLVKMVCKSMDWKNVLLYSSSIILSAALEMFLGTAFMAGGKYRLHEKAGNMSWLCTMFFLAVGIMSVFFILYATGYYARTKNKDYSLLLMLGSSRKFIFWFFSVEFLLIYVFSMVSGILAGGAFSALFLAVLGAFQYPAAFSPADVLQVVKTLLKANSALFLLEFPLLLLYFGKRNLSDMQRRGVRKERKPGITCFLAVGGGWLIVYAMSLLKQGNILYHFISMAVCLAGIYIVMSYGGSLLLMLLKRFKKFYYGHLITLNEFYYKFKSSCRLLFLMLVLDFVVLFFTGGSVISQIPQDVDSPEYPYGFVGVMQDGGQNRDLKDMTHKMLGGDRVEVRAVKGYQNKEEIGLEDRGYFCISDREYSRITAHSIRLEEGEALLINESTAPDMEKPEFLYLSEENVFAVTQVQNEIVFGTEKPNCLREFAVLPESVVSAYEGNAYCIIAKKGSLQKEFEQYGSYFQEKEMDIFWRCEFLRDADENLFFTKIVSVSTGIFCLFSCFGIFALKLQGDLPFLNRKYKILYHIGMPEKSIYKAMSSEYRKMLGIPAAVSVLLAGVYMAAEMTDRDMAIGCIPFQAVFICLNIAYFYWVKKMVLRKNLRLIIGRQT